MLLISSTVAIMACSDASTPEPTMPPTPEVRGTVGPDGGQLWFDGGVVDVPPGALDSEVELVWAPIGAGAASDRWQLSPEGLTFAAPIQVTVPLYTDVALAGFQWEAGDGVRRLASVRGGDSMTAQVSSSGVGEAVAQDEIVETVDVLGRRADILFVIDDSCSMEEEQGALAVLVDGLVERLNADQVDYRMAVATTDMEDQRILQPIPGSTRRYVSSDDADPASSLASVVLAGTQGSFDERGLDATLEVLNSSFGDVATGDFLREGATLDVLVVSDENDFSLQSNGMVRAALEDRDGRFHALVGVPLSSCSAVTEPGVRYISLANDTGGTVTDLCGPFQDAVDELGVRASGRDTVTLMETPNRSTLSVEHSTDPTFDGQFYSFSAPDTLEVESTLAGTLTIRYLPID